ncbi:glycosyltransferase family 4 protein [Mesorhizobium sp. M0954]|uniref:glycosyltransferase family 4 protein n=1 Tax=Mesorhizobium sp. M0954 TaxID=2957032 RepID=UPI00333B9BA6
MRVVICANTGWNLHNFRSGVIRALIASGVEVIAVAPETKYSQSLVAMGCRFEVMPMESMGTSPVQDLQLLFRFWRLFRKLQPDFFLGYTIKPNIYGSLAAHLCGVRAINNISGLGTAFLNKGWLNHLVRRLYRWSLWHSRHVFFQNPDDRSLFLALGLARAEKSSLLPGSGVDLEMFAPAASKEDGARFLLIARLIWDKGIGEYVEAARLVKQKHPGASFGLLGLLGPDNPSAIDRETLQGWISEGIVEYYGRREDVRPVITEADCIVLPSYYPEGTPRTLIEGAAMGKPLIAADVPGCREVINDGVNGYLCQPRNAADLAQKLTQFLELPRNERAAMGLASRKKAENQFDEKIVIDSYMRVISAGKG